METVILCSDVARLVLRYLQDQGLEDVSLQFCKSSPHLKKEFVAYRQGLLAHSFFPALEELICEYVKILQAVNQYLSTVPDKQVKLRHCQLSDKINAIIRFKSKDPQIDFSAPSESTVRKGKVFKRKRKSSLMSHESNNEIRFTKRRRCNTREYYFLNTKNGQHVDSSNTLESTVDESSESDKDQFAKNNANKTVNETDLSRFDMPKNESTPRNKLPKHKRIAKALPEITQAILDNTDFQTKLVNNINQALHTVDAKGNEHNKAAQTNLAQELGEIQTMTSNQLDEMVKNILEATERDPTFDAIIEEVVGVPDAQTNVVVAPFDGLKSQQFPTATELPASNVVDPSNVPLELLPASRTVAPPRTPLIIRNLVATATAPATSANSDPNATATHIFQPLGSSNSFGMYMDPNCSFSKLVVMNSNESTQKQGHADQSAISIGNSTADHILSQLASGTDGQAPSTNTEQVLFDMSSGPLTFPVLITHDGLIAPIAYSINNNGTQITTHMESNQCIAPTIVMPTPAGDKPNAAPIVQSISDKEETIPVKDPTTSVDSNYPVQIGADVPTVITEESTAERDVTPSTSGIFSAKFSKSFSTPRRRSTHVRTLTFSPASSAAPLAISGATPHSTRRNLPTSKIFDISTAIEESTVNTTKLNNLSTSMEKAIIRNVEILPQLSTLSSVVNNESSNSCSVPPLFAGEESSNQTVIKTDKSLLENSIASENVKKTAAISNVGSETLFLENNTPKRKQSRRTAVRLCKRQLSKSSNEEKVQQEVVKVVTATKRSAATKKKTQSSAVSKDRNKTKEISVSTNEDEPKVEITLENVAVSKKNTQQSAASKNKSKEINSPPKEEEPKAEITLEDWKKLRSCSNSDLDVRLREINANRIDLLPIVKREKKKNRGKRKDDHSKETDAPANPESVASTSITEANISDEHHHIETTEKIADRSDVKVVTSEPAKPLCQQAPPSVTKNERPLQTKPCETVIGTAVEVQRRTANIGYLLETPFKNTTVSGSGMEFVPPTPGVFMPTLDTPHSKSKECEELRESASFLFGSLTKSELGSPMLSAITPGLRFTPLLAKDTTTPRSVAATEYSSGGSYYRPDESEEVDHNFDKILRDSSKKQQCSDKLQQPQQTTSSPVTESDVCVEIPVETLKVAPIVLKRVKSFGQEGVSNFDATGYAGVAAASAVDPHYTLASELPDICAQKEEARTTTSSSSSDTSSSSGSSSSSCDSSSSSDSESENDALNKSGKTVLPAPMSLDNLSDISSTEDEDWQKLEPAIMKPDVSLDEGSNLIDQQTGEVRYPVRSWLTPRKPDEPLAQLASAQVIKMTIKSAEKINRSAELALKRERIKLRLEQDIPPKVKTNVRRQRTTKPQRKTQVRQQQPKLPIEPMPSIENDKSTTVDVLTALQLSAKKPATNSNINTMNATPTKLPPPGEVDDNAVSTIFAVKDNNASKVVPNIAPTVNLKTLFPTIVSPVPALGSRVQGKCIQIEAIKSSSRAASKLKQIVRTPLGFKGAAARSTNTKKTEQIKLSPTPKIKITSSTTTTTSASVSDKTNVEKIRVSPRLQATTNSKKKGVTKPSKTPLKGKKQKIANKQQPQQQQKTVAVEKKKPPVKNLKSNAVELSKKIEASELDGLAEETKTSVQQSVNQIASGNQKYDQSKLIQSNAENLLNESKNEEDYDDEDDDPSENCDRVTFGEFDSNYFTIAHNPQKKIEVPSKSHTNITEHLKNFELKLAFDENTTHTCRISESFTFFQQAPSSHAVGSTSTTPLPTPILNIPKKRQMRFKLISPSNNGDEVDGMKKPIEPAPLNQQGENKNNLEKCSTTANKTSDNSDSSKNLLVSSSTSASTNKIQICDIESILSKIHDAGT